MAHTQLDWKHIYITVIECYFYKEGYVCIWIITQCASNLIRWEWFVSHCQLCSVPTWYLFEPVKGLVWSGCLTAYQRESHFLHKYMHYNYQIIFLECPIQITTIFSPCDFQPFSVHTKHSFLQNPALTQPQARMKNKLSGLVLKKSISLFFNLNSGFFLS